MVEGRDPGDAKLRTALRCARGREEIKQDRSWLLEFRFNKKIFILFLSKRCIQMYSV